MRSGSATISRTVIRGLRTRTGPGRRSGGRAGRGASAVRLSAVMSRPSKMIVPAVGSSSFMIVRPSVVFPQPDSPTTPSVSPRANREVDPVHCPDLPDRVLEDARLDREVLYETLDAQDLVAAHRRRRAWQRRPPVHRSRDCPEPGPEQIRAPRRSGMPSCAPRRRRGDAASARRSCRSPGPVRVRTAGWNAQAGRRRDQARRLARDRLEPLPVRVEPREAVQQPDGVRVPRRLEDREDVAELDDPAPRT